MLYLFAIFTIKKRSIDATSGQKFFVCCIVKKCKCRTQKWMSSLFKYPYIFPNCSSFFLLFHCFLIRGYPALLPKRILDRKDPWQLLSRIESYFNFSINDEIKEIKYKIGKEKSRGLLSYPLSVQGFFFILFYLKGYKFFKHFLLHKLHDEPNVLKRILFFHISLLLENVNFCIFFFPLIK